MTSTDELIACARHYTGVRFVHQGRSAQGVDCLGLLILVAQECELMFDGKSPLALDMPQYGTRPDVMLLKQKLDDYLMPLAPQDPLGEGDVALLKIDGSPQHLALMTDYPMAGELGMIHAYAPARQVIEHRYDAHWRRNLHAAYRLPQVARN